jgi:hypothetical protein
MSRFLPALLLAAFVTGCAMKPERPSSAGVNLPARGAAQPSQFSQSRTGGLPPGWEPLVILRDRKPTEYRLVHDDQGVVLHARAERASSALMHALAAEPERQPWLQWQWKIKSAGMRSGASPADRGSPVRIVLGFDGDKESLLFSEQILFETAKLITGHDFPYATLMYVWAEDLPVGTVVQSRHSSRIRMIVVESGPEGVGGWRRFSRNFIEDFERAFGEKPGRLLGVGVLTDHDPSEAVTEAWYGDIHLSSEPLPTPGQAAVGQSAFTPR